MEAKDFGFTGDDYWWDLLYRGIKATTQDDSLTRKIIERCQSKNMWEDALEIADEDEWLTRYNRGDWEVDFDNDYYDLKEGALLNIAREIAPIAEECGDDNAYFTDKLVKNLWDLY